MFQIEMLPAGCGDALLVSWGKDRRSLKHILVDGGLAGTSKVLAKRLAGLRGGLELLVVTHIDNDHILGILGVLGGKTRVAAKRIWFNGWKHIARFNDRAGVPQGNSLMRLLDGSWAAEWNLGFEGEAVYVPDAGKLPAVELGPGARVTLLSPTADKLGALAREWRKIGIEKLATDRAGRAATVKRLPKYTIEQLAAEPFREDGSAPNGSSIAFILEAGGKRVLFAADAHAPVLLEGLKRFGAGRKVKLDAFKLPHHGSERNLSPDLLRLVDCPRYLVSTDGKQFEHPDDVALARVVTLSPSPTLYFNYATDRNAEWRDPERQRDPRSGFTAVAPERGDGLVVDVK